jgi:truncated hemoglobin YjbI/tellurite resistance-related uncharacterized protein
MIQPNDAITDPALAGLVDDFYGRVRKDALIGPLFNDAVADWPHHLERLTDFWSSVMLTSGRYKGNPVAKHLKHVARITTPMFARWLELWRETTSERLPPAAAAQLQDKAERIAESLQLAIRFRPGERPLVPRQKATGDQPYRSTPIFDQDSLPAALRREHRTKAGAWGAIQVLDGALRLHVVDPPEVRHLAKDQSFVVAPEQAHWVELIGPMRMRVDFYDKPPAL